jgi:hypothetical protein
MTATETARAATATDALTHDPHLDRAVELGTALGVAVFDDPSLLEEIPHGAVVFLLPAGEPDFLERSLELGVAAAREGRNVYFKHVPAGFGKEDAEQG